MAAVERGATAGGKCLPSPRVSFRGRLSILIADCQTAAELTKSVIIGPYNLPPNDSHAHRFREIDYCSATYRPNIQQISFKRVQFVCLTDNPCSPLIRLRQNGRCSPAVSASISPGEVVHYGS